MRGLIIIAMAIAALLPTRSVAQRNAMRATLGEGTCGTRRVQANHRRREDVTMTAQSASETDGRGVRLAIALPERFK